MKPGARERPLSIVFITAAAGPGPRAAPLGAARVASAIKAHAGFSGRVAVAIVEGFAGGDPQALAREASKARPDIVGLSLYSWNSGLLKAAAALVKASFPEAVIVAGGPDASADPERLAAEGLAGIVVAGEGEAAIVDIVAAMLEGRKLPGPVIRAPLLDPATLPSPWLDGTLDPGAWGGAALELARGCPFRCAFCFESKGAARVRRFPMATVAKEIDRFQAAGIEEVFVLDPTFNADSRRMAEAIRIFGERGPDMRYILELRAELLTPEQARLLSTIACSVQIGLQSSDPAVLQLVDRQLDPDAFAHKIGMLDEEGIVYGLDLIYGLPGDSLPGFKRSLDYALGLGPNHLDVFRLAVLPGTALADKAIALGLERGAEAPYLVRSTPTFGAPELDEAERLAKAVDLFYTRGRAVMWFRPIAALARMRPSAIVSRFADYMTGRVAPEHDDDGFAKGEHAAIEALQLGYLAALFAERPITGNPGAADAALDLVRVSGAWTRALAEGESTEMDLGWEPEALLDYASADIGDFASESPKRSGRWECSPGQDGPRFRKAGGKRQGRDR